MLNELYRHAVQSGLAALPGYKEKYVKAYIRLTAAGEFAGIDDGGSEKVPCPDIGSTANGTDKCNFLVEKAEIVLLMDPKRSRSTTSYWAFWSAAPRPNPGLRSAARALTRYRGVGQDPSGTLGPQVQGRRHRRL